MLRRQALNVGLAATFLAAAASSTVAGDFSGPAYEQAAALSGDQTVVAAPASPQSSTGAGPGTHVLGPCRVDGQTSCFFDATGKLHHWMYAVDHKNPVSQDTHQYYLYYKKHGQGPPATIRENIAAFASIRDEQSEYNAWFASHNCTVHAGENDSCNGIQDCLPRHINDSGTLNLRTLKITYYRNACAYAALVDRFKRECLAVGAGNDASACRSINAGHLNGATLNLRAASLRKVAAAIAVQEKLVDGLRPLTKSENYASYGYSSGFWPKRDIEDDHLELENLPGSFMMELDALQAAASEELSRAELLEDADAIQGGQ